MSKARLEAARTIAQHLFAAENATDLAFGSTAHLAAILPKIRADAGVSAIVANSAFASVAKAIKLQAEARAALVEAHEHFAETADAFRIKTSGVETGFGDSGYKIPPNGALAPAESPVRRVA